MSKKTTAVINISKALLGVSFTTLATVGGAIASTTGSFTSAAIMAGLAALPAAGFTAYTLIKAELNELQTQEREELEIPAPSWWKSDPRSWQDVCLEIEDRLPAILSTISQQLSQDQRVKTYEVVQQIFIDALAAQHLT